jgi:phage baseplate assembly protein gpV
MNDINALKNIVRIGTVSTVNAANRTARVIFQDKANLVSGPLIVLQNQPSITVHETELTYGVLPADGHTHDGKTESHTHELTITPWLPNVGQLVVCLYLPNGESDGFVLGGI